MCCPTRRPTRRRCRHRRRRPPRHRRRPRAPPASDEPIEAPIGDIVSGDRVLLIGDSVLASAAPRNDGLMCEGLVLFGWEAEIDAEAGRQLDFADEVLDARLDPDDGRPTGTRSRCRSGAGSTAPMPDAVEAFATELDAVLERVSPRPAVLFTLLEVDDGRAAVNDVIRDRVDIAPERADRRVRRGRRGRRRPARRRGPGAHRGRHEALLDQDRGGRSARRPATTRERASRATTSTTRATRRAVSRAVRRRPAGCARRRSRRATPIAAAYAQPGIRAVRPSGRAGRPQVPADPGGAISVSTNGDSSVVAKGAEHVAVEQVVRGSRQTAARGTTSRSPPGTGTVG